MAIPRHRCSYCLASYGVYKHYVSHIQNKHPGIPISPPDFRKLSPAVRSNEDTTEILQDADSPLETCNWTRDYCDAEMDKRGGDTEIESSSVLPEPVGEDTERTIID